MGDVFDVPDSTFSPEEWMFHSVVIELEAMGPGPSNFFDSYARNFNKRNS